MRSVLAIAEAELKRFNADKSNIFFVFIFPLALVFVLGASFGSGASQGSVAVAGPDSGLRADLVAQLQEQGLDVTTTDVEQMRDRVARGASDVGVVVAEAAGTAYEAGQPVDLELVQGSQSNSAVAAQEVRSAASTIAVRAGQVAALTGAGVEETEATSALATAREDLPAATVAVQDTSEIAQEFDGLTGQFQQGAASQLLLFVFVSTLSGGIPLIKARRDGVVRRTLAAPVTPAQGILGQTLGRLTIAFFQGGYIMLATRLLFGVEWGDLGAVLVVLLAFGLVASGAAMLIGVLVDNEGAGTGLAVGGGLILGALGGCMFPLELFPDGMRRVANATPHSWAYEALADIQRHGAGVLDVLPQLGVLLAMAAVVLALGAWAMQRSLSRSM